MASSATIADVDPLEKLAGQGGATSDPDALRCPPGSSLRLTGERERKLVAYVIEMVRYMKTNQTPWSRKRDHYLQEFQSGFEHRKIPGAVFDLSNLSFNQSRRNTMPIVARLIRDYFGTEPFFAVTPVRMKGKSDLAEKIQNFVQYKLAQAKLKSALSEAIELAAVVGQRVVKVTHVRDVSFYKRDARVLVDDQGQAIRTRENDVIYEDDEWVDSSYFDQIAATENPGQSGAAAPAPPPPPQNLWQKIQFWKPAPKAEPIQIPQTGISVLKKDPDIVQPDKMVFKRMLVSLQHERFKGTDIKGVHHKDFLCPLEASDIQTTPIIAQRFELTAPEAVQRYVTSVNEQLLDPVEKVFFDELKENMLKLQGGTSMPKIGATEPDRQRGEVAQAEDKYNPRDEYAEAYVSVDVDGSGKLCEVMITVAVEKEFALFYDYTPNVVDPGIGRPFRVVRIRPVADRWYGIGEYEWNEHDQEAIDWFLNRVVYENSISGMLRCYDPDACDGWDTEAPTAGDRLHRMKNAASFNKETAYVTIPLPAMSDSSLDVMKMFMQSSQAAQGNLSPGADTITQIASSRLKYGIQAIERSGDENYALHAIRLNEPLSSVVEASIHTELANMDALEEFEYEAGDQTLTATMSRSEVEGLKFTVGLEMTLSRGDQINDQCAQATELVKDYMAFPAFQRGLVRTFYVKRLQAIDIPDAEDAVPQPSDEEIQASYQAYMQSMLPPPPPGPTGPAPTPAGQPKPGAGAGEPGPVQPAKIV